MTKVVFGIMSAFQRATTVSQLVSTLGGRPVIIHHDFHQRPDFRIDEPNVGFVPDPVVTGWGTWGFCEAIVRTLEYCLEHVDFDYFQLLSPTCLPLRPIAEFESQVADNRFDGNIDLMELKSDPNVMMTFGWRFVAPRGTLRVVGLRRARAWYFSRDVASRHRSGLSVLLRSPTPRLDDPRASFAALATRLALDGWLGRTPFRDGFRPYVGSCWFGANRAMAGRIIAAARDPSLQKFFEQLPNADESFFPTVMGNSGMRLGPSNHLVNFFNETGNPHWLRPGDLDRVTRSGAFFARKFPDDPMAQVRLDVLDRVEANLPGRGDADTRPRPAGRRKPRLAFGMMSAAAEPKTIAQLASALAPHRLVLNHDYGQQPDFALDSPNVSFMPEPRKAAYGTWSWSSGVLQLLQHCVENLEFDYFQLLSPLCLPIKPVARFADFIAVSDVDANVGLIEVTGADALMSFGHRLLAAEGSARRRWLERAGDLYFGDDPTVIEQAGMAMRSRSRPADGLVERLGCRLALAGTRLASRYTFATPPEPRTKLFVGAPWFGATREVCDHLLKRAADPDWADYFRKLDAGGDLAFATLLGNSGFRLGASNHLFSSFSRTCNGWLGEGDERRLQAGSAFFARRFSHDPASPIRLRMLASLQAPERQELPVD
ncbi:MAG TPA: beta-1,6-N-acetylglucosaminyltransferase [Burkholderiaceae bacterium]|nr:beta-1,6-N-acetylglucosaminyltransferase [Burkholderiaceae bacterium]